MNSLYLLRGPPGAGKTTLANTLAPYHNYAADMWFTEFNDGCYEPSQIPRAHQWCRAKVAADMKQGSTFHPESEPMVVAVHNTFIELWEMKPYLDLAAQFNYQVFVLIVDQAHPNVHSVPEDKVTSMAKRFQFNGRKLGA